ncbi:MAG: GTP-binding protein [Phycisphaerae bacterium]|nr:GTP-binding protein [Phycisphaerae bacterium]
MQISAEISDTTNHREQMDIVIIGHVDHGKSTLVGRLLADTGALPQGKLDAVREQCRRNAKPFEYAFLLDALKEEQSQGITIDSARCFFKSARRDYIIIDAPGHLEFLKNMISGAARAEAGLLVIDAHEGVKENSRRHGYLMSLLGIRQIAVCVNKMDLVNFDRAAFESIRAEYSAFLDRVGIRPAAFLPISALNGDNIVTRSAQMPWHDGPTVLDVVDSFVKEPLPVAKPLRMPVQDVYKFTEQGDDRRIIAGRIETGSVAVGDDVVFQPSGKRARVASIEAFNADSPATAEAGQSTGVTLDTQLYVRPGEVMSRLTQPQPRTTTRLRASLFWLSHQPMIQGKRYKLKLASARLPVWLTEVKTVLDASSLESDSQRRQIERHDVAECVLETLKPVACDLAGDIPQLGRFVIIDNYEIAGGGIVLAAEQMSASLADRHVQAREKAWDRSRIASAARSSRYNQRATLVLIAGPAGSGKAALAKRLEEKLFSGGRLAYFLGVSNSLMGINVDMNASGLDDRDEYLRRLGEVSHLFTDAGLILITSVSDLDDDELDIIATLNQPNDMVIVTVGESELSRRKPDLRLPAIGRATGAKADPLDSACLAIQELLQNRRYLPEYYL